MSHNITITPQIKLDKKTDEILLKVDIDGMEPSIERYPIEEFIDVGEESSITISDDWRIVIKTPQEVVKSKPVIESLRYK